MSRTARNQFPYIIFVSEQPDSDTHVALTINWADHPAGRVSAMQVGNPRELKLIGQVQIGNSRFREVLQAIGRPLLKYKHGNVGHWYTVPKEIAHNYIADCIAALTQNPNQLQFSLRGETAPLVAKPAEPWIQVKNRRDRNTYAILNSSDGQGPHGNGKLKVSRDGVLSVNAVPIPKSPPLRQLRDAVNQYTELKAIVVHPQEVQTQEVQAVPAPAIQAVTSVYDLF